MSQNTKYKNDFAKEKYDKFPVVVAKGEREKITEHYKKRGYKSMNDYIKSLIYQDMNGGVLRENRRYGKIEPKRRLDFSSRSQRNVSSARCACKILLRSA